MRTIGCLCFAKTIGEGDKFAARSVGVVLMGYSSSQKAYRLYNISNNSFFVRRDVKFMEHIFPFQLLKKGKLQLFPNGVLDSPVVDHNDVASTKNDVVLGSGRPPDEGLVFPEAKSIQMHKHCHHISVSIEDKQSYPLLFSEQTTLNNANIQLRKLARTAKEPVWMHDYVCNGSLIGSVEKHLCKYPMQSYISHADVSAKYQSYLSNITNIREPLSYEEVATDPKWIEAMHQELAALKDNDTWTLVDLPI
ncbi:uncharacterized protein LOC142162217 [Nicotiana tabacum]|uniref:Uncharacterized protein LOC142162217 n=1 Tax=Nicotiana tabacum TaxID=4097 RepID=A0AC58RPJ7_TOBAC